MSCQDQHTQHPHTSSWAQQFMCTTHVTSMKHAQTSKPPLVRDEVPKGLRFTRDPNPSHKQCVHGPLLGVECGDNEQHTPMAKFEPLGVVYGPFSTKHEPFLQTMDLARHFLTFIWLRTWIQTSDLAPTLAVAHNCAQSHIGLGNPSFNPLMGTF